MKVPKEFRAALDWVVGCVKEMQPLVFSRFHDGEYRVCQGHSYTAAAGWRSSKSPWLQEPLVEALSYTAENYVIGISPPCCAPSGTNFYYRAPAPKTFATIFHNANYRKARVAMAAVDAVLVGDHPAAHVKTPSNGVEKKWDLDAVVEKLLEGPKDKPIFLAAGPTSCVLAHRLSVAGVTVPVIDVGALFDDRTPRHYKTASPSQRHVCTWGLQQPAALKRVGGVYASHRVVSPIRTK